MAQKPIGMEQLKQTLQLNSDGVSIRMNARRLGIRHNSVRKYLLRLNNAESSSDHPLADKAYNNDLIELEAERLRQVTRHFTAAGAELCHRSFLKSCPMAMVWTNGDPVASLGRARWCR